jgi:hypothetical protein
MSFSTTAMSAKNMPCLVRISTVAMSAKMPHLKYASSHPGSPYATKRGHALIATQPESFPLSVNSRRPTNHRAKSRSALMLRQTLGRSLVIGSKQSANPLVSLQSRQFPRRETACAHSLNLRNPPVAVNPSFRPAPPNCNRVADPVTVPSSTCAKLPTLPLSCIESSYGVLTPLPATPK